MQNSLAGRFRSRVGIPDDAPLVGSVGRIDTWKGVDVVLDAVRLSKAVGKPVKVIFTREEDLAYGKFRPMTAHYIEAGFDAGGRLVAWHHRVAAESIYDYRRASDAAHRSTGFRFVIDWRQPSPPGSQDCSLGNDSFSLRV